MFQPNSFNGIDLMVLFNWGWSRLINKFSLIWSLNLLASRLEYQNDQSVLNSFIQVDDQILLIVWHFKTLSRWSSYTYIFCNSSKKVAVYFTIISNYRCICKWHDKNIQSNLFVSFLLLEKSDFNWELV